MLGCSPVNRVRPLRSLTPTSCPKPANDSPSPWGEGRGEGGRATNWTVLSRFCGARMASLILQLLAFCLLALAFTGCERAPHSSPTALRDTNAYFKALSPAAHHALDPQALDRVSVTLEGETLVATYPDNSGASDESDGFSHVVDRLKPGEKLEGDGAVFEMVAFAASGPGISKTSTNKDNSIPLDWFGPPGKLLDAGSLKKLGFRKWDLVENSSGSYGDSDYAFPKLQVALGSMKQLPGYYSAVGVFDGRTKRSLVSGHSCSQIYSNSPGRVWVHPHAWHATPMELVLDVELDGRFVVETNPVPELKVAVPGGEVKLLGIWDGSSQSWSSSMRSGLSTLRLDLQSSGKEAYAFAAFVTEPRRLAVHFELLDAHGKVLEGNGGGSSDAIRIVGLRGCAADVKQVRFTVFTNHHQVVLTLPPIPNLPAEYQNVDNLFNLRIPQVNIEREYELQQLLGDATQMKFAYSAWGNELPTNVFPMVLTNVTPAQLLAVYRQHLTNGCTVVVDEKKQEIRVEPTQAEKVKRWVKQKLRLL